MLRDSRLIRATDEEDEGGEQEKEWGEPPKWQGRPWSAPREDEEETGAAVGAVAANVAVWGRRPGTRATGAHRGGV